MSHSCISRHTGASHQHRGRPAHCRGLGGLALHFCFVVGLLLPGLELRAHPGNVIATLHAEPSAEGVKLEVVLTFDGTGDPLLGAQLWWEELPHPAAKDGTAAGVQRAEPVTEVRIPSLPPGDPPPPEWSPFGFGGAPHKRIATLPTPSAHTHYILHILSLGERAVGVLELEPTGTGVKASPREVLILFPDVGLPDYQLGLILVIVVVGMVLVVLRGAITDAEEPGA